MEDLSVGSALDFIFEVDRIRVVRFEDARAFWTAWWAEQRRK